jgi:hypothetical protein
MYRRSTDATKRVRLAAHETDSSTPETPEHVTPDRSAPRAPRGAGRLCGRRHTRRRRRTDCEYANDRSDAGTDDNDDGGHDRGHGVRVVVERVGAVVFDRTVRGYGHYRLAVSEMDTSVSLTAV